MIRKKTALFLVLFAKLIFLFHVVIPHHHHEDEFYFFNLYCNSSDFSQSHFDFDHHNEQKRSSDLEYCNLIQEVIIPFNYLNHLLKCISFRLHNSLNMSCNSTFFENKVDFFFQEFTLNPIPPLIFNFTQVVSNLFGFRAPPFIL